jgi:hypothetical protein
MEMQQLEQTAHELIARDGLAKTFENGAKFVAEEIRRLDAFKESLTAKAPLTPAENTEFEKAYRDLAARCAIQVNAYRIAVVFDGINETPEGYRVQ